MIAKIFALSALLASMLPTVLALNSADTATSPKIASAPVGPLPGMPAVTDANNLYSDTAEGHFSPAVAGALTRVYVPEHGGDSVSVIDPSTMKVVDHYAVGNSPQHIVPSWDLKTLWVTNNNDIRRRSGSSLTPIDPTTGKPGKAIEVTDAYNMYFMPDGSAAIVINEAQRRLDFRDPHSMKVMYSIQMDGCYGLNHADFSTSGTYAIFSCEFGGGIAKVDLVNRKLLGIMPLKVPTDSSKARTEIPELFKNQICTTDGLVQEARYRYSRRPRRPDDGVVYGHGMAGRGMPQDVRISPDGKTFYIADMISDGVFMVDGDSFTMTGFIPTGPGAHGFCVSRDGKKLYISNRGSHAMPSGSPHGPGSVAVLDFATNKIEATWAIPGGGSPDMGEVSADGKFLWFSGRFDNEVYAFATDTGAVTKIKVGSEPHGLTVWPQPGRYSLGHTGNMR